MGKKEMVFTVSGVSKGEVFKYQLKKSEEKKELILHWLQKDGVVKIELQPKIELTILEAKLECDWECGEEEAILMNGYQSWTDTHEKFPTEKEHNICSLAGNSVKKYALDRYGDIDFTRKSKKAGQFHGETYCYFRDGEKFRFLGSLSERCGYTIFYYDYLKQKLSIEKECNGLVLNKNWKVFELCIIEGDENAVFDRYFELMNISPVKVKPMRGYTSWYNHYQNISEKVIYDNLNSVNDIGVDWDVFQIDDGYQRFVGDWLSLDTEKFPNGLKNITDKIHEKNMKAGLWLAPFVCEKDSVCFKEHQDWLVRGKDNEPYCAGCNWSSFYPLNLELEEVREYIRKVFSVVLNEWDFDLVKLDFLYAVCMLPTKEKTRGQLMCEAMDFLREIVGDKLILGCGVPLGAAFGKVDFCRVGCDVSLDWDDKWYMRLLHRERVSTKNTIGNTIYRRQLDKRAFLNDPDVYLLREDNMMMSEEEKEKLAIVNALFGSLLFTSDNINDYDEKKLNFYKKLCLLNNAPRRVEKIGKQTGVFYKVNNKTEKIWIDL